MKPSSSACCCQGRIPLRSKSCLLARRWRLFLLYSILYLHTQLLDRVVADDEAIIISTDEQHEPAVTLPSDEVDNDHYHVVYDSILNDNRQDSLYDPLQANSDCAIVDENGDLSSSCFDLPVSTLDETTIVTPSIIDATCSYGGEDPDSIFGVPTAASKPLQQPQQCSLFTDKHWGSDSSILHMREKLRRSGSGASSRHDPPQPQPGGTTGTSTKQQRQSTENNRPPIFLMPGLASTRLVAWRFKSCRPYHALLSDIKVQDYVWLNINLVLQMSSISIDCFRECLALGWNQSDTDDVDTGCKLRPDEGLDAISSLSPGGIGSNMLIGGTNTVYAWLIQWLADNLGYDVSNIVGLPYDWRLSPDKMEDRDGFLTLTRRRIEAAVESNGKPGIMVAHSMGNLVFRYFLEWMQEQLKEETYTRYIRQAKRRAKALKKVAEASHMPQITTDGASSFLPGWMPGVVSSFDEWWTSVAKSDVNDGLPTVRHEQLWELAQMEGNDLYFEWVEKHIWSYVGLAAPMLGAVNPLRAVISGESMGLPVTDEDARGMELTFGSTHTVNPISTKEGFCDSWDAERWDEEPSEEGATTRLSDAKLACLDDIFSEIEYGPLLDDNHTQPVGDPWEHYPALRVLLKERRDWSSDFPMVSVTREYCKDKEKPPCASNETVPFGAKDVQTGKIFLSLNKMYKEEGEPLKIKQEQLKESFWDGTVKHFLNRTWERPIIKHVVLAYGVDVPTEVAYEYRKVEMIDKAVDNATDSIPRLAAILSELAGGQLEEERMDTAKGFPDLFGKKRKRVDRGQGNLPHSGDGSVPYLSLAWAHTWLLHAARALRYSHNGEGLSNPLDDIKISHRPQGAVEWLKGPPPKRETILREKKVEESSDTGTSHPHGTKYKPEMIRYHNTGTSRTTDIEYSTTVIEAIHVEHKETTRNYDILAAVFTDILEFMHDDMDF